MPEPVVHPCNSLVRLFLRQGDGTLSPYKSSLVKKQRQPEVVTLTEADVQRMKTDSHILTAEERTSLRHALEERKEHERAAAKARKEKMLRLAAEAKQLVRLSHVLACSSASNCCFDELNDKTCSSALLLL